jgi:3-isopropylmalate/(R)-2-methylmalate dehydratase small subunit
VVEGLFAGRRYLPDGRLNPDFPFNQVSLPGLPGFWLVIISGRFLTEHAPWALVGWGIRAIISTPSPIFFGIMP